MVDTLIRLFPADAEDFTTLGLGAISDAISCDVQEVVNGSYELRMVYPADGIRINDIALKNVIYCKPQPHKNPQPFDIYKIVKGIGGTIEVYAEHSSYRLSRISVSPFSAASLALALQGLKSNAVGDCPFTFTTDKTVASPYEQTVPASIRQRLGGEEGSILDLYGGEYEWDNFTVKLWGHRGTDRGVTIRYGKNLTDLTQEQNIAGTYTGVYPFWRGTVDEQDVIVTLPEKVVYSEHASQYPYQMTVPLDLSMAFQEQPTVAQLRSRAQSYITSNNIGVPKVSLKVSFIDLQKTSDYANVAPLEQVDLGDTVTVQFEKLGVDVAARVVSTDYNVLTDSYNSVEIGNIRATLSSTIIQQSEAIKQSESASKTFFEQAIDSATKLITGGLGGNIIFHFNDTTGLPDEMIIMDTDNVSTAVNCIRLNKNGIGFSQNGYNGPFNSAWTIDGTFDAGQINVINLNATSITAGTLKSANYDSSGGTAGFLLDLVTGNISAPSLTISAVAEANAYTDGQVSGAISTAAADATSKANAAQAAAKSYTDTQISVIPGQISSAISNIQIGGTNLLHYTADYPTGSSDLYWYASGTGASVSISSATDFPISGLNHIIRVTNTGSSTSSQIGIAERKVPGFVLNEVYSEGCWVRASVAGLTLRLQPAWNGTASQAVSGVYNVGTTTTSWQYIKVEGIKFTNFSTTDAINAGYVYMAQAPAGSWLEVCGSKLELGNKATDWSPNPEDLEDYADNAVNSQAQATSSQITQLSDRITSTVTTVNNIQSNMLDSSDVQALIDAGNFATSSSVTQTSNSLQVLITQAQNTANSANSTAQTLTTGVTVDSNGVTVGKSTSAVKGVFSNNALEFQSGGKAIAWLSADSEEGLGVDTIQIGDHNTANQRWIVFTSSNGSHLSFTRHQ